MQYIKNPAMKFVILSINILTITKKV